jgi:sirohydrochlorin ferrochelatase
VSAPPLVAVAHGSRDPAAARATEALLAEVRRQRPGLVVHAAYLDHEVPRLADRLSGLDGAVVVPLLLGAAYHSSVDIPRAVAAAGGRVVQAGVLGPDPALLTALERRLAESGVRAGDPSTAVVLAAAGSTDVEAVGGVRSLAAAITSSMPSAPAKPPPARGSTPRSRGCICERTASTTEAARRSGPRMLSVMRERH